MADLDKIVTALRSYEQTDEAGVMVLVSRQACDEAASELEKMRRQRDNLLSYINGISRQTAEMVRANSTD